MPLQTMSYWNALMVSGSWVLQRLEAALRHGEWVVGEVDLLLLLVPLVHREVDDPAELEGVGLADAEVGANPDARRARELGGLLGLVAGEEHRVARRELGLGDQNSLGLDGQEFGDRPPCPSAPRPRPSKMM